MADMILTANELAFRTAYATSSISPDIVGLAGLSSTSPTGAWNLTSEQPYILSPNLTLVSRTLAQDCLVSGSELAAIYNTHRRWVAGSIAVVCSACIIILCTYWDWWRLGRDVSMSPLEIARAFDAPLLQTADPNATGDDIKKDLGARSICLAIDSEGRVYRD
jgi:hypothetical protein